MPSLTQEEIQDVQRIFHHLFNIHQNYFPQLEKDSVLCVELPISFRDHVVTASFTGGKKYLMLGVGRLFANRQEFSYSSYSHVSLGNTSLYRHVNGIFLRPADTDFELKYAPLHSRDNLKTRQGYAETFFSMHDFYAAYQFQFFPEFYPAFFSVFAPISAPKLFL